MPSCGRCRTAEHLRVETVSPKLVEWMYLVSEVVSSALVRWAKGTVTLTLITLLMATIITPLKSSALMPRAPKRCNYGLLSFQGEL